VLIRNLRPSDFDDIVSYYFRFYDEVKENPSFGIVLDHNKPSLSQELLWFSELYKNVTEGRTIAVVAEKDSHIVGLCEVSELRPDSDVSHRGQLGISVNKDYRGKGAGTSLLKETLQKCKGKFEIVELCVLSSNQSAKKLYEKFGFKTFGIRPKSIKRGDSYFDEDMMRLEIKP
jgi:RimJ/RimL family protein N-acetyltransferase